MRASACLPSAVAPRAPDRLSRCLPFAVALALACAAVVSAVGLAAGPVAAAEPAGAPSRGAPDRITWEQVRQNPDDVDLSIRFARQQIEDGDHLSASATLERVLLIAPGNLTARVLYAVTLYRLDSFDEAKRQLDFVLQQPLSDQLRKELRTYEADLGRRQRSTKGELLVHSGVRLDTNPSRLPSDGTIATSFGTLPLAAGETQDADVSFLGYGKLTVEHDLGLPQRRVLFASLAWLQTEYLDAHRSAQLAFLAEAGARLHFGRWEVTPQVTGAWTHLSHEQFMRSLEGRITVARDLDRVTRAKAFLAAGPRLFDDLSEAPDQRLRTGTAWRGGGEIARALTKRMRLTLGAEIARWSAVADHYSATGYRLFANHEWRFRNGVFLLSHLSWRLDDYDGRNPVDLAGSDRRDHHLRAGSMIGVPFLTLAPSLPRQFDRTALTFQVDYTANLSNIDRYTYDNWRFVVAVTKRFDF